MNEQTQRKAKEFFSNNDYRLAIQILQELGVRDFISKSVKNNWYHNIDFISFINEDKTTFEWIFNSKYSDQVLFNYFNNKNNLNFSFLQNLASNFPEKLITAIRVNKLFLSEKNDLFQKIDFKSKYHTHQKIWGKLSETEFQLWNKIEQEIIKISSLTEFDVLSDVIIWLEEERFLENGRGNIHVLSEVYNFFIKMYLQKNPINNENLKSDIFFRIITRKIGESKHVNNSVKKVLNSIREWIGYNTTILEPYCFDLNIEPIEENGIIYFNQSPISYYNWKKDGVRYNFNKVNYLHFSTSLVEQMIDNKVYKNNDILIGNNGEINKELEIKQQAINSFLIDLSLENVIFNKNKINIQKIIKPLLSYSTNRMYRYEKRLEHYSNNSKVKNWKDSFKLLTKEALKKDIVTEPYILLSEDEYIKQNINAIPHLDKETTQHIIKMFAYYSNPKHNFNRFNIGYNVWEHPFIKIGNLLFSPMMFFATNDWFYSIAQVGIKNLSKRENAKERKDTATKMEEYLGKSFSNKNWQIKVIGDKEANKIKGDVDLIIDDGESTLFIQLKRTYFKLNLKDAYFETIHSDRKATQQLIDAEKYFRDKKIIGNGKNVTKWIVSTSFENIGSNIEGCLKVNYNELLLALKNENIKSIFELKKFIENDSILKKAYDLSSSLKNPLGSIIGAELDLPIPLVEPKLYQPAIFLTNKSVKSYNSLFTKAINLSNEGKNEKAIKYLEKCKIINPKDIEVYGVIGNCYANIKDYDGLKKNFEEALTIQPNEPFIKRNYGLALIELGKYYKGLKILLEILEIFPLVGDIKIIVEQNYKKMIECEVLTSTELIEIESIWNKL